MPSTKNPSRSPFVRKVETETLSLKVPAGTKDRVRRIEERVKALDRGLELDLHGQLVPRVESILASAEERLDPMEKEGKQKPGEDTTGTGLEGKEQKTAASDGFVGTAAASSGGALGADRTRPHAPDEVDSGT